MTSKKAENPSNRPKICQNDRPFFRRMDDGNLFLGEQFSDKRNGSDSPERLSWNGKEIVNNEKKQQEPRLSFEAVVCLSAKSVSLIPPVAYHPSISSNVVPYSETNG
ncbi:MAG: hypothetical protein LBQ29_05760, partial [Acinetobacter sp.]|uniref:hypothetical protein n=1 Tax=Acinetobacter sp. TaxID=472 RepID=UPI0028265C53